MFDVNGTERLAQWKKQRDTIETCDNPLQEVVNLWSSAPFVSNYLDPSSPKDWPDPWRLVLDGKFDDLAICLGMLYTLQLTQRFMHGKYEIHMSVTPEIKESLFYLSVDRSFILNYTYKQVVEYDHRLLQDTTPVFSTPKEK